MNKTSKTMRVKTSAIAKLLSDRAANIIFDGDELNIIIDRHLNVNENSIVFSPVYGGNPLSLLQASQAERFRSDLSNLNWFSYSTALDIIEQPITADEFDKLSEQNNEQTEKIKTAYTETGDTETGDTETGDAETGDTETGDAEAGDAEAGDAEAGDAEAGDAEAGDAEAGDTEAGDAEAGDAEAGDAEAGDEESK